jgi:hypothetical protein
MFFSAKSLVFCGTGTLAGGEAPFLPVNDLGVAFSG